MFGRLSILTRQAVIAQRSVNRLPSLVISRLCSSDKHQSPSPPDPATGGYMGQRRMSKKEQSYLWSKRNASAETFVEHVMRDVVPQPPVVQIVTKTPRDSYRSYVLPFGTDMKLRDQYVNAFGGLRFGKILEDLDAFAAEIGYVHADGFNKERPLTIVTASCDRIDLFTPLTADRDIVMEGCVAYVGRSSMVVRAELSTIHEGVETPVCVAAFTLVAKDRITQKPTEVNHLQPKSERETALYNWGKEHSQAEKAEKGKNLFFNPPSAAESEFLHSLFMQKGPVRSLSVAPTVTTSVAMDKTTAEDTHIMMPQERNIHDKIFGGFLMRKAYELGWSTALMFSGTRPHCLASDHIEFRKPVPIGTVTIFSSVVSFVEGNMMQVLVEADIVEPKTGTRDTTNVFSFTYSVPEPLSRTVRPRTYREGVIYLQGKKAYERTQRQRTLQPPMMFTAPLDT